ncbi:MAG: thioredoxin domain-containing protein [Candidatus Babeliales bacterium]|jgi:thioredoxin 1
MFSKKQSFITLTLLSVVSFDLYTFCDSSGFWGYANSADTASVEITQDMFEKEVLQSDIPVILDVYAVWCGPCQMLKPIFAQVAQEFKDSCKLVSIDYDKNLKLTSTLEIRCFPTMLVYHKGKIVQRLEGFPGNKEELAKFVQAVVDSAAQN